MCFAWVFSYNTDLLPIITFHFIHYQQLIQSNLFLSIIVCECQINVCCCFYSHHQLDCIGDQWFNDNQCNYSWLPCDWMLYYLLCIQKYSWLYFGLDFMSHKSFYSWFASKKIIPNQVSSHLSLNLWLLNNYCSNLWIRQLCFWNKIHSCHINVE